MKAKPLTKARKDINQLAKSIVDMVTSQSPIEPPPNKNWNAVELGRLGGKKGGKARAEVLTAEERIAIAKKGATTRWLAKKDEPSVPTPQRRVLKTPQGT